MVIPTLIFGTTPNSTAAQNKPTDHNRDVQAFVRYWLAAIKRPNAVRSLVDIDPYNSL
ncbi:hypothetical protein [Asticcacaulis sp. 201]|uniref:hypothetical protein n=1 Tax=Asticcacaulis sp. 201 TaxID=3028787 RepID=UPI0029161CB3|nr:hypothetical protein [Asticcacaulis sp. 201]MDV6333242.1 hypothetical protein [Asticcacaulis sp. 201]